MAFKKNTAVTGFTFGLVSKTDGSDVTTGTPAGYVTIDGGVQTAIADVTPVHEGNGQWSFDLTAAEMNGGIIGLAFTHTAAITVHFTIKTEVTTPSDLNNFNPATDTVATVTDLTNLPSIPNNWITAAGITASALNGKGDWNIGKTGYTLTQSFPANFADMAITLTTGKITVGTNSDKTGYSISGTKATLDALNDVAATDIVSAGAITTSLGKVSNVALVNALTTYTGNTPQTGDGFAIVNDPIFGNSSIHDDLGSLSVGSAAISKQVASYVLTTGLLSSGLVSNTETLDGVYHIHTDAAGAIDLYYEFSVGSTGTGTEVSFEGYLTGNNDSIGVYAYDWVGVKWDQVGTWDGSNSTTNVIPGPFVLLQRHTGSGADVGKIRMRLFAASGLTSITVAIDQIYVTFAINETANITAILADTSTTLPTQITGLNNFNPATDTVATVTNLTNLPSIPTNWITAAGITASALNGKGDWNIGKTGYTLTQSFPTNFADMAITLTTGKITVGTNSDKTGYSISGTKTTLDALNDIAAASIVSAGAITTSLGKVSNVALVDTTTANTDMRGTDGANTTVPDNTSITSILADTGTNVPAQITALNDFNPATDTVDIGKVSGSVNAATRLSLSTDQIIPFTVSTSILTPTVTDFQASDITEATTDHYNGRIIIWSTGALAGQATSITAYSLVSGQGKFTVVGMTEAPANGDTGIIV